MAWMRMMGADSVEYHRQTVLARGDDHPGQALAYYASRGETPLFWGGRGAKELGLEGAVTDEQYQAIYGVGGACDPTTGERLVRTTRPGLELVVSAHKSVAELGVIGRPEDMHRIMDAERDATLAYLDDITRSVGGRRGRAAERTPTEGLIYATARHATSRAGDPNPHDHVLLANLVRMADERGGWKAATTALWREHLHAATMVGRLAAAHEAIELGYAIVRDGGPSGRLGHWAIAGVPEAVMDAHSKRAAEIAAEIERRGADSYQARNVAARTTRDPKRHVAVGELLPRWVAEAEAAGWSIEAMAAGVEREAATRRPPSPELTPSELRQLAHQALAPDGPLTQRKVFSRRDVIVAVAPHLYGRDPSQLERVVERTLADPEAVPLLRVAGAHEQAHATALTIAREQAIAASVQAQATRRDAAAVSALAADAALARSQAALGHPLTSGQRAAVEGILTSRRGVELVVGVAGSGKTTALAAVRDAFEAEGYEVVGTSTSGQAARTLAREAGIAQSRTLASLNWRIQHNALRLSERHVAILDEAAMTDDAALLAFLEAAREAQTKVVLVGDPRQLSSVGPGGGFESLVNNFGAAVHVLADNVRQRDPAERAALDQLRAGDVERVVAFYAEAGRIALSSTHQAALEEVARRWGHDVAAGSHAAMYAWRRANVAALNRLGRQVWEDQGRLAGPELAVGDTAFRAGERIVTLAPGAGGQVVTSETGTVLAVDVARRELAATMDDDGRIQRFGPEDLDPSRLAHGYAITVHRSQGATVERVHVLEDGGGRELAYVKMSRAKEHTTLHVVADSVEQAVEDLARSWRHSRRIGWAIDAGTPLSDNVVTEVASDVSASLRHARLVAEREALGSALPTDPGFGYDRAQRRVQRLEDELRDLERGSGWGVWRDTPVGDAARALSQAVEQHRTWKARAQGRGLLERRQLRNQAERALEREPALRDAFERLANVERARIAVELPAAKRELADLGDQRRAHWHWESEHPEAYRRLDRIEREIEGAAFELDVNRQELDGVAAELPQHLRPGRHLEPDGRELEWGLDIGW